MPKLRKQRRRKAYNYNVNRKRLKKKMTTLGKIACKEIKNAWEFTKSSKKNFEEMGLVYDLNSEFKTSNVKQKLKKAIAPMESQWEEKTLTKPVTPSKNHVIKELEDDANAPRISKFALPDGQVEWITYLMDTYGEDYKAMARDKKNYYQETWKQLRAKIKRFMNIPEQYSRYLEKKKLLDENTNTNMSINSNE